LETIPPENLEIQLHLSSSGDRCGTVYLLLSFYFV